MERDHSWKIGELAAATGLTIRALHHYDGIGLLKASGRSDGGHRLYAPADVERLYRVLALRALGLSLQEIAACLDDGGQDARAVMRRQLEQVERQLAQLQRLRGQLRYVLEGLDYQPVVQPSVASLMEVIRAMSMSERYYTEEQRAQLRQRADELGAAGPRQAEADWATLIAAVRAEQQAGTPTDAPRMQALARHWRDLVRQFTGGDAGITRSLGQMYQTEDVGEVSHGTMDREVMAYAMQAVQALPD
jgi:MerR family transcriptional regulator, thiopeptide resistance regulator